MENKINVAELLKDCPKGMELDCTMYDNAYFEKIDEKNGDYPIIINIGKTNFISLTKEGHWNRFSNAKCVIFPKGKTTWEGFHIPFKDGDILTSELGSIFVLKESKENDFNYGCYIAFDFTSKIIKNCTNLCSKKGCRFATKEEKQKLFQAITDNGYHWNSETKTWEKFTKFKVGDIIGSIYRKPLCDSAIGKISQITDDKYIFDDGSHILIQSQDNWELITPILFRVGNKIKDTRNNSEGTIIKITDEGYECRFEFGNFLVSFKDQDNWELVIEPIFKVGNRIKYKNDKRIAVITAIKNNCYFIQYFNTNKNDYQSISIKDQDKYELVPNKFDITALKPFKSSVLVRDNDFDNWKPSFWGYLREGEFMYDTVRGVFRQCIPYEGNEHLLSKTYTCADFYKTWEK